MAKDYYPQLLSELLEPIPQYVLGCLPAIAIIGASPMNKFTKKLTWVFLCLGCPFIGLFYTLNVGKRSRCIYWLPSVNYFIQIKDEKHQQIEYRPFGVHTMALNQENNDEIMANIKRCTAKASVFRRLISFVSAYYIVVGLSAGISMVTRPIVCERWPYIPSLFSWTIPALYIRIFSGDLVVRDPYEEFGEPPTLVQDPNNMDNMGKWNRRNQIIMNDISDYDKKQKLFTVTITAFISICYPWITVILAYFTPPVGYLCRSKYITVFCVIWSFNSALAYLFHLKGEKKLIGKRTHLWVSFCGVMVAIFLFILALLTNNDKCGWICSELLVLFRKKDALENLK